MSKSIKGITVEIGGDTTGLDRALKGVNSEIRSTQSELKGVERFLKLDPTNTELLKQKQQLLAKSVSETSEKLKTLKTAEAQAQQQFKEGKISQEQYNTLKQEIVKTEESLKLLKTQAAHSNVALQKIGTTAGQVAEKTKGLSLAAGGALTGIGAAAIKAGRSADDLNTLAKQTGITTAELQKMQYASDIVDVSVDTITGSMRKMKKNMDSNSKDVQAAWQAIGVSTTDASGQMKPATDIFYETIEALSKVGNETERDQIAMQIFGKSADELAGVIDDGGAALKQLGSEAENSGLIMSQDALDGANEFNDGIDKLKATAAASFGKIAGQLSQTLIPVLEKVSESIGKILNWLTSLSPTAQKTILIILAVVAAISPIAGIISGICTAIGAVNAVMLISPVTWIVLGIVAAVAALIAIVVLCIKNFDTIKAVAENVWNSIKYAAEMCWYGIKVAAITVINLLIDYWNMLAKAILFPINAIIKALNLIPGINIKEIKFKIGKFNLPEMPKMANGGTLRYGSAIVGESGPELLTQMGNRTQVTPLTGSQAASALSSVTNNYGARQQVNVFSVDGETVTKVIQPTVSNGLSRSSYGRRRAGYAY